MVDVDEAEMAIKGDGSSLTIALRGNYAQAAWANRPADIRLRVFLYRKTSEYVEFAVGIVIPFDLCASFSTKVHKNGNREFGSTEITTGLVVFPVR